MVYAWYINPGPSVQYLPGGTISGERPKNAPETYTGFSRCPAVRLGGFRSSLGSAATMREISGARQELPEAAEAERERFAGIYCGHRPGAQSPGGPTRNAPESYTSSQSLPCGLTGKFQGLPGGLRSRHGGVSGAW